MAEGMIRSTVVGLVLAAAGCAGPHLGSAIQADDTSSCLAETQSGAVQGVQLGGSCTYKGIPYGASTGGANRWQPPQPAASWAGVRDASQYGAICAQIPTPLTTPAGSEDCLFLNIWAPNDASADDPLPVVVYIHGGGSRTGSGAFSAGDVQDGQYMAEHGHMLVVNFNFRLGAFGYMASPALDATAANGLSGNYGSLDQLLALHWVQDNIANFGGDLSRITVMGESSGAQSVVALIASPLAAGLFSKAIVQSSGPANFFQHSRAEFEAGTGASITSILGCTNAVDQAACLRAASTTAVIKANPGGGNGPFGPPFQVFVDGYVLNDTVLHIVEAGLHNHVPMIVGTNHDENSFSLALNFAPTDAAYQAAVIALPIPADVAAQALALYPSSDFATPRDAYVSVTTDRSWLCPNREFVRALTDQQKEPVYRYLFVHPLASLAAFGTFHTEDLNFLFHDWSGGPEGPATPTADELALSDEMIGYWARFAANGDPNDPSATLWPVYGKNPGKDTHLDGDKKDCYLQIGTPSVVANAYHGDLCDAVWDPLLGWTGTHPTL